MWAQVCGCACAQLSWAGGMLLLAQLLVSVEASELAALGCKPCVVRGTCSSSEAIHLASKLFPVPKSRLSHTQQGCTGTRDTPDRACCSTRLYPTPQKL